MDSDQLLQKASGLAEKLVLREVDINELKKLDSYFNAYPDVDRLLALLEARWQEAKSYDQQIKSGTKRWQAFGLFVRSGTTYNHIKGLHDLIPSAVTGLDQREAGFLLGWTARLATAFEKVPSFAKGDRHTGTVKWFNADKRFGFIKPDGGGDDLFVHISETPEKRGLQEDQRVSFSTEIGPKGPRACDVQPE